MLVSIKIFIKNKENAKYIILIFNYRLLNVLYYVHMLGHLQKEAFHLV